MKPKQIRALVCGALEDLKAKDIVCLDVNSFMEVTDFMVIATGTSNRHVRSLAENVIDEGKKQGLRPLGVEGEQDAEWVLVDFGDVLVHAMLPEARAFYDLESLWSPMHAQSGGE